MAVNNSCREQRDFLDDNVSVHVLIDSRAVECPPFCKAVSILCVFQPGSGCAAIKLERLQRRKRPPKLCNL